MEAAALGLEEKLPFSDSVIYAIAKKVSAHLDSGGAFVREIRCSIQGQAEMIRARPGGVKRSGRRGALKPIVDRQPFPFSGQCFDHD